MADILFFLFELLYINCTLQALVSIVTMCATWVLDSLEGTALTSC